MTNDTALTPITQARQMLAAAETPQDFRNLRTLAATARAWAQARGLGVDAENEATEVVLRAERALGGILRNMREQGLISDGNPHLRGTEVVTTEDIVGFSARDRRAGEWMRLSDLPDSIFDDMLRAARERSERLAKWNFYAAAKRPTPARDLDNMPQTPEDPDFGAFRKGAFGLLGWEVGEDGTDGPTRNGLTSLPEDELRLMARVIKALAVAYNEAKAVRG